MKKYAVKRFIGGDVITIGLFNDKREAYEKGKDLAEMLFFNEGGIITLSYDDYNDEGIQTSEKDNIIAIWTMPKS